MSEANSKSIDLLRSQTCRESNHVDRLDSNVPPVWNLGMKVHTFHGNPICKSIQRAGQRPYWKLWPPIENGLPGKVKKNGSETGSADIIRGKPGNEAYRKTRLDQFSLTAGAAVEDDRVS